MTFGEATRSAPSAGSMMADYSSLEGLRSEMRNGFRLYLVERRAEVGPAMRRSGAAWANLRGADQLFDLMPKSSKAPSVLGSGCAGEGEGHGAFAELRAETLEAPVRLGEPLAGAPEEQQCCDYYFAGSWRQRILGLWTGRCREQWDFTFGNIEQRTTELCASLRSLLGYPTMTNRLANNNTA